MLVLFSLISTLSHVRLQLCKYLRINTNQINAEIILFDLLGEKKEISTKTICTALGPKSRSHSGVVFTVLLKMCELQ